MTQSYDREEKIGRQSTGHSLIFKAKTSLNQRGVQSLAASVKSFRHQITRRLIEKDDKDFLPAHLEILETPPSPMAVSFAWTICAIFILALIWSIIARIDVYATAAGRIIVSGRSKIVQPFETSKVRSILVHNGDLVKEGQILVDLDNTEAMSELAARESDLQAFVAQVARRRATVESLESGNRSIVPDFPKQISGSIRDRELAAMLTVLKRYDASRDSLIAQISEKRATQRRYSDSVIARSLLRDVLDERAKMRQTLVSRGAGTRAAVIDALQQVDQANADIVMDKGQLLEAEAAVVSLQRKIEQTLSEQIASEQQNISDISQKADIAFQDALRAKVRLDRLQLRAPIDGSIQQLAVTTQGQVVTGGQPLAVVVPADGPVEIEAMVLNEDIGFVKTGQDATVKVDSFPFIRYGTIHGKVVRVSHDGVDAREANGSTDALSIAQGRGIDQGFGTAKTQNLVFPASISLENNKMIVDGQPVSLTPGMTVTVDLHTGRRRVIDYLLSPIREAVSTAGHER